MEVEIKLRLRDSSTHQKLSNVLAPFHSIFSQYSKTILQENIFFDGANRELTSKLAVLRLRFYDLDQCVLSLKAKPVIGAGISRMEEQEEPLDPSLGRACIAEPWRLLSVDSSEIVKRVREEYGVGESGVVCLGGFRNVRGVHEWKGLKLELDETNYDFGTSYELECESDDPERDKKLLQEFLRGNGIDYSYSGLSKFAVFQSRKLPQ
ncbi:triphosphate tunnel metalloenzyme 3 [Cajanus cajan]|uniref:CYTH domain-containing protein n=1 Tax=Cajanus cajan TaxID=3821 RepID=A0A151S7L9_CAJCA|nr:triphosphate tunnel metalloenzyme 3 [Cajanus cajan]KYP50731.1 hypothetical protein KK1_027419 [Cajanus cajan]